MARTIKAACGDEQILHASHAQIACRAIMSQFET
jgi:hypothetical protein